MSAPAIKILSAPQSSAALKKRILLAPAVRSSMLEAIRAAVEKVAAERERRIAEMASRQGK
jgi:hypothetical protein